MLTPQYLVYLMQTASFEARLNLISAIDKQKMEAETFKQKKEKAEYEYSLIKRSREL